MNMRLLLMYLATVLCAHARDNARDIIEQQSERHTLTNEISRMEVTLIDRKGRREERMLRRLDKKQNDGMMHSLTVFDLPKDVKGTALLTRENGNGPNDQWLYFPSQKRMQRIAQARRSGYFMGTDFTFEDMDPENTDDFTYRHLQSETVVGHACHVIEAVPADRSAQRTSGYGKRILWIRKDILFSVKIEFYDKKGKLLKTQTNSELEELANGAWRAKRSFMDNHAKCHQTDIKVVSRDVDTKLTDDLFTARHITTGRYMQ